MSSSFPMLLQHFFIVIFIALFGPFDAFFDFSSPFVPFLLPFTPILRLKIPESKRIKKLEPPPIKSTPFKDASHQKEIWGVKDRTSPLPDSDRWGRDRGQLVDIDHNLAKSQELL